MQLNPVDRLSDSIMRIVAATPGISVADLHRALKKAKVSVTLQHLYRKINLLTEEEVLLKRKGELTMNLMWLSYLEYFATSAKEALKQSRSSTVFPLTKGERISFPAGSIAEVQTLWHHLLVQLHRAAPQKQLYKYYSHAWWVWNKRTLDVEFYKKIYEKGVRCLWLYGGNTSLDRAAAQMYPDLLDSRIAEDAPFPKEGYNLNVYGDYVFECVFPPHIARHLELIFRSVTSTDKRDDALIDDIFAMQGEFVVTVWHNPVLAAKMRTQIGRYFLFGARKMPEQENIKN